MLTFKKNEISSTDVQHLPLDNYENNNSDSRRNSFVSLNIVNSLLKSITDSPDSLTSFKALLHEVNRILNAEASALYICNECGEYELLSITDDEKQDLFYGYLRFVSIDNKYNAQVNENKNEHGNFNIKILNLNNPEFEYKATFLLQLSISNSNLVRTDDIDSIKILISEILASALYLDKSKRNALHEERALIARELHDSLAQSLSYLKIQVSRLQSLLTKNSSLTESSVTAANGIVEEIKTNLNISYKQLRELITTFRLAFNSNNLAQALEDSVEEFENRSSVAISIDNRLTSTELNVDEEIHVLQIIREAISNVVRHSQASHAEVLIKVNQENTIEITIDDNGVGIHNEHTKTHRHGLIIMQQRIHELGGKFRVHCSQMGGTQVKATFKSKRYKNISDTYHN